MVTYSLKNLPHSKNVLLQWCPKLGVLGKLLEPWKMHFWGFSTLVLFCTIPKTENLEMKTSEFLLRHFDQTLRYFDETPRFSNSECSIFHCIQNWKLGDKNLGVFPKTVWWNSQVFHFRVFGFGYNATTNLGDGKTCSLIKMYWVQFILNKVMLIKVSYYLERIIVTQFNQKNHSSGEP